MDTSPLSSCSSAALRSPATSRSHLPTPLPSPGLTHFTLASYFDSHASFNASLVKTTILRSHPFLFFFAARFCPCSTPDLRSPLTFRSTAFLPSKRTQTTQAPLPEGNSMLVALRHHMQSFNASLRVFPPLLLLPNSSAVTGHFPLRSVRSSREVLAHFFILRSPPFKLGPLGRTAPSRPCRAPLYGYPLLTAAAPLQLNISAVSSGLGGSHP